MMLPAWLWILVTILALAISIVALVNGLATSKRLREITKKTGNLEMDMEQFKNSLNQERERLEKIESEQRCIKEAKDISNTISGLKQTITDLEGRKKDLEGKTEVCAKLLDAHHRELKRLESERQQQESVRKELAKLEEQVGQEREKRDDYAKEIKEFQGLVSSLNEEYARLKSEMEELQFNRDIEKEILKDEEPAESVVKRRLIRKHSLMT